MLEEKMKKDLDGKYIVFEFTETTEDELEGSDILLYKVLWPTTELIIGKSAYKNAGFDKNRILFEFMRKKGITEVIAPQFITKNFLNIELGDFIDEDDPEYWSEVKEISEGEDTYDDLIQNGIKVLEYDVSKAEFD